MSARHSRIASRAETSRPVRGLSLAAIAAALVTVTLATLALAARADAFAGPSVAAAKEKRKVVSLDFYVEPDAYQVQLFLAVKTPSNRACLFGRVGTAYAPPTNNAPPVFVGSGVLIPYAEGDPDAVFLGFPLPQSTDPNNRHYGEFRGELSRKVVRRKGRKYICEAQDTHTYFRT